MKEKFYVFLDIDGVLYDWPFINSQKRKGGAIKEFKPESMQALNYLIENLEKKYDVELVLSSTWRYDLPKAKYTLKANGLKYNKEILPTIISPNPSERGREIWYFLTYQGKDSKTFKNFVILDDEDFDYHKIFEKDNIIKTSIYDGALSLKQVKDFLQKQYNINNFDEYYRQ